MSPGGLVLSGLDITKINAVNDETSGNNTHQAAIKDCKELDYINVLTNYLKTNNINLKKASKMTLKKKTTNLQGHSPANMTTKLSSVSIRKIMLHTLKKT
eukprot:945123-Ditylum_brightwellii.AAC.1